MTNGNNDVEYGFTESVPNDSTTCRPTVLHDGRWHYDCDNFEGALSDLNPVALIWHNSSPYNWGLVDGQTVQSYLAANVELLRNPEIPIYHLNQAFLAPGKIRGRYLLSEK